MNDIVYLGSIYGKFKQGYDGSVYSAEGILPTMLTNSISNNQVGCLANQITSTRNNPNRYRVYLTDGIAPTLDCAQGGGRNPYIIVEEEDDEQERMDRS